MEEDESVKARPRIPPEKDRRDRGPPPEQWNVKAVSPRHCPATSAPRNCCFNWRARQSHKDNVRCTAVEEQPEAKEVQLSQPSSTSLLMISSGLRVQLHLPTHDLFWAESPAPPPYS